MMGIGYRMMGGGVFSLFILLIVLVAAFFLFNNYTRNKHLKGNTRNFNDHSDDRQAEEMARQRYAKGEITKSELNEILNTLNKRR